MLDKLIDKVNYPELVKELRETSMCFGESDNVSVMLLEAANAIDDLCEALAEECEEKDYLVREMAKNGQLPKQAWGDFSYEVNFTNDKLR